MTYVRSIRRGKGNIERNCRQKVFVIGSLRDLLDLEAHKAISDMHCLEFSANWKGIY